MKREKTFWKDLVDPAVVIPIEGKIKIDLICDEIVFFHNYYVVISMSDTYYDTSRHSE